jgi:hypothetical protein
MVVAWVCEHSDVDADAARAVLDVEFEYQVGVGIVDDPDFEFRYYTRAELVDRPRHVDTQEIARDAERLAGVPYEVGLEVTDWELDYLEHRRHSSIHMLSPIDSELLNTAVAA